MQNRLNPTPFTGIPSNSFALNGGWKPPYLGPYIDPQFSAIDIAWHDARLKSLYPGFETIYKTNWGIAWKGILTPLFQSYEVLITFFPGGDFADLRFSVSTPRVYVLNPRLERRPDAPNEWIPHIYWAAKPPHLCLYHPAKDPWDWMTSSTANDIIPWASEWLLNYELWHVTGEWSGLGAHPQRDEGIVESNKSPIIPSRKFEYILYTEPVMRRMGYLSRRVDMSLSGWAENGRLAA